MNAPIDFPQRQWQMLKTCQICPNLTDDDILNQYSGPLGNGVVPKMKSNIDEILTIDEVALYLKAGKRTVYRLAASGKIPAFKLGGTWRVRRSDLDQWIASRIGKPADDGEGQE